MWFRSLGPVKATEAADAWAAVLDRMEEAWMASSHGHSGNTKNSTAAPVPPLRVFMRLGALYTTLGRIEEAKVRKRNPYSLFCTNAVVPEWSDAPANTDVHPPGRNFGVFHKKR